MKPPTATLAVLTALLVPGLGLGPRLAAQDVDTEALYKQVVKSTCVVATPLPKEILRLLPPLPRGVFEGILSTGALVDAERRIVVTSYQVVEWSDVVYCMFPLTAKDGSLLTDKARYKERIKDGLGIRARVLIKDKARGLALIKLDRLPVGAKPLPLAARSPAVGSTTWNIGCPEVAGQVFSVTEGKVRGVGDEKFLVDGFKPGTVYEVKARIITTTNPTNEGDTGGPLVNKAGELVGVTLTKDNARDSQQVNPFVDVSVVRSLLADKKIDLKDPVAGDPKDGPGVVGTTPAGKDPAPVPVGPVDVEDLYKKVVRSCVFIVTPLKGGYAMGSGSLIDVDKRLILTNYHVVHGSDYVYCQFPVYEKDGSIMTDKQKYIERIPTGQGIKGKVLYSNKSVDLAFVELEKLPADTPALPLAAKSVGTGATTWNIGSPGAVTQVFSITEGKVRGVGFEKFKVGGGDGLVFEVNAKMVTTTNPTNGGDSGGPLFDKRGYLVAVTQSGNVTAQQVNMFVDVTEVRAFLKDKGITIKELGDDPKPPAKGGPLDPRLKTPPAKDPVTPPAKDPGTATPPKTEPPKADPPAGAPTPADERAAADLLRRAKLFSKEEDQRPIFIDRLKEIIKKYPGTAAAKDAKRLLDDLK